MFVLVNDGDKMFKPAWLIIISWKFEKMFSCVQLILKIVITKTLTNWPLVYTPIPGNLYCSYCISNVCQSYLCQPLIFHCINACFTIYMWTSTWEFNTYAQKPHIKDHADIMGESFQDYSWIRHILIASLVHFHCILGQLTIWTWNC